MILIKKIILKIIQKINFFFLKRKFKKIAIYHVPKTGGTSIKHLFIKSCGRDSFFQTSDFLPLKKNDFDSKNRIFIGHKSFKDFIDKDLLEITILRDPIDLYISYYFSHLNFDKKNNFKKLSPNIIQKNKMNIKEYVNLIKIKQFDNIVTRIFSQKINPKSHNTLYWDKNNCSLDEYCINEKDFQFALTNLKKIKVYYLENMNYKKFLKSLNVKLLFFNCFRENKSIKNFDIHDDDKKLISSICYYDKKILNYLKANKMINMFS